MSLNEKQFLFSELVARFIWELRDVGFEVTLGEAYRPQEMADIYAKTGAGIINSLHTLRLAIDLNLFKNGKFLTSKEDYEMAGELWESYSTQDTICTWGGRFLRPDADHFSLAYGGTK